MSQIPEIMDGANIADFVDADIEAKLAELEAEEELLLEQASANGMEMEGAEEDGDSDLDEEEVETVAAIRNYKGVTIGKSRMNESSNRPVMPRRGRQATRNLEDFQKHLTSMGIVANKEEAEAVEGRMR